MFHLPSFPARGGPSVTPRATPTSRILFTRFATQFHFIVTK